MGFNNPGVSWSELERRLSDRPGRGPAGRVVDPLADDPISRPASDSKVIAANNDSPSVNPGCAKHKV